MIKRFGMTGLLAAVAMLGCLTACNKKSTGPDTDPVFDTTWTYSRTVTLAAVDIGATDTLTDYPLLVRFSSSADSTGGDVLTGAGTGGASLRFTTADGVTALPHEIEYWSTLEAAVWVRVPSVRLNAATALKMYWGDSVPVAATGAVFDTAAGFEAVFHLAEATGFSIYDATPNRFKGVPVGTASIDSATQDTIRLVPLDVSPAGGALIGSAKNFRGVADNINVGGAYRVHTATEENTNNSMDLVDTTSTATFSAWVKVTAFPSGTTTRKAIISKSQQFTGTTATGQNQWSFRALNATQFNFARGSGAAPAPVVSRADAVGVWTFVTYTRTASNTHTMRVYNEAGPVSTASQTGTNGAHADVDVFIGGFAGPDGHGLGFFSGLIDEVRVSNTARSNAWHDLDFATQRAGASVVSLGATATEEHVTQIE